MNFPPLHSIRSKGLRVVPCWVRARGAATSKTALRTIKAKCARNRMVSLLSRKRFFASLGRRQLADDKSEPPRRATAAAGSSLAKDAGTNQLTLKRISCYSLALLEAVPSQPWGPPA